MVVYHGAPFPPRPRSGGQYCVGRRMKFRSCNSEPCSKQKKDFREEQCASFDGRHFNINGLPPNVRWVPKYSGSKHHRFLSTPEQGIVFGVTASALTMSVADHVKTAGLCLSVAPPVSSDEGQV